MQSFTAAFLVALSCVGLCSATDTGSPVEKVVKLLTDMQVKMKADGASEKATFEKYSCWCTGMTSKKGKAIETAKTDLKSLGNDIMSLRGKIAKLSSQIDGAAADMKENHEDQQTATEARDKENAAFTATHAEMSQALQGLNQALKMLNMAPQFLQTQQKLSTEAADAVRSAIDGIPDKALGSIPAAKVSQLQTIGAALAQGKYSPSYGSIVTILDEMNKIFTEDLGKETKTEAKSAEDYAGLMATKVKELVALQDKVDKKEADKADAQKDLADTTQTYDDTDEQMNADIKFFNEAVDSCEKKAQSWETRQKMRAEELSGVEKAIEILTSDDARALFGKAINAESRVTGRVPNSEFGKGFFLQLDATSNMPVGQQKAFKVLKDLATKSQNVALARIAAQVRLAAKGGHFGEVMGAIDKVIGVLKTEQDDDNKKKTQCNDEYQNVAQTSRDLEWKIEKNEAKIDKLESIISNKEDEKAATIESIKETIQEIKDMKAERKAAKEAYDEAKTDDDNTVVLLNKAKDALEAFAKKHKIEGAVAALVQEPKFDRGDAAPETAEFSDKGNRAGQTKGIASLLQSIIEGVEEEIKAQTQFEKDSIAAFDKALKSAEDLQKKLETKKTNLSKEIADRNKDKDDEHKDKKSNEADLKDEQDYKAKIKPDCDFMLENWQSRFNKRKAEMDGLVTAKDYLAGAMGGAALAQVAPHF